MTAKKVNNEVEIIATITLEFCCFKLLYAVTYKYHINLIIHLYYKIYVYICLNIMRTNQKVCGIPDHVSAVLQHMLCHGQTREYIARVVQVTASAKLASF